jgi:hypothetical protein
VLNLGGALRSESGTPLLVNREENERHIVAAEVVGHESFAPTAECKASVAATESI